MPTLASDLRNQLERTIIAARDVAEIGVRAALEALAVHDHEPYPHMKAEERKLRNHLRARARQLGDRQDASGRLAIHRLVSECAYEHWHRMLFARFLAENNLLIEPVDNMAISLAEAEEMAKEEGVDVWVYASRCAQRMLPQIFRPDDPLLRISFATEHLLKLEKLLASLPAEIFTASDALGWVYQFWQSKKKDEVNHSEVKIGADEISAVTQLFTEPYLVEFLLHNTLGAWWAGKKLTAEYAESAESEPELRKKLALPGVTWDYLRFVRGDEGQTGPWRPAAGTFDGWPRAAKDIKVLDPCCGSGHFLVAALHHLVPIRMAEEGLSPSKAVDAVLRDNLHGLEIDERCCQIAAFALALAVWRYPEAGGYRSLPELHIACTGIGPQATKAQWLLLAEKAAAKGKMPAKRDLFGKQDSLLSSTLASAIEALFDLFAQAPILGSLIDPRWISKNLYRESYESLTPLLSEVFKAESDDDIREQAIATAGMVKAAELLGGSYTLIVTNVPYLGKGKQDDVLRTYLERHYRIGRTDLATAFILRCMQFCAGGGTAAMVTPQNWLFLTTYMGLRESLLKVSQWNVTAKLGPGAFETISGHVVNIALVVITSGSPSDTHVIAGIDALSAPQPKQKAEILCGHTNANVVMVRQKDQLNNPGCAVSYSPASKDARRLGDLVDSYHGITTTDLPRFQRGFWECVWDTSVWTPLQSSVDESTSDGGRSYVLLWDGDGRAIRELRDEGAPVVITGLEAWGRLGVAIRQIGHLPAVPYLGTCFDTTVAVLIPRNEFHTRALISWAQSSNFLNHVRRFNQSMKVEYNYFPELPIDEPLWEALNIPGPIPEPPESVNPTQWLFNGWPSAAQEGMKRQVAVARLLGYRWPAELDDTMRLSQRARALVAKCSELARFADNDGIVCIPAVRGEEPAAERLLHILTACGIEPDVDLDNWLRNSFGEEHCKLFHDRPFILHIWDGRKRDGFHALVNYHKLSEGNGKGRKLLESLTYSYLGDWITRQRDGVKRGEGGAEDRLTAALELQKRLEAILAGEPPFDIFVRWKPLHQQPIGWNPDINDGVRLNIRPFLASDLPNGRTGAGIIRFKPNIKWGKDRGKEPHRPKDEYPWFWGWDEQTVDFFGGKTFDGNRWNDCHYSNGVKQAARSGSIRK